MKTLIRIAAVGSLALFATGSIAADTRDCMLEGTVQKGQQGQEQSVNVKFHSVSKYDQDSTCRVRRGEKMEFKLPADPRLTDAEPGSTVKYRYRTESDGTTQAELVSVGT
jgi:hypothetical protein